jgi:hypothetical protein
MILKLTISLFLVSLLFSFSMSSQLVINEFSASNFSHTNFGSDWNPHFEDWIELYNNSGSEINLEGYFLSDDPDDPEKWTFPNVVISPNQQLLVLASGMGDYDPDAFEEIHTNFKLRQTEGEYVVFSDPDGNLLESYDFDEIGVTHANHSWARSTDGEGELFICTTPTPGEDNLGEFYEWYAVEPIMDLEAGFYDGSIQLQLSTTEPNADIFYTLDGSESTDNSWWYTDPLTIGASTVVKAIVYSNENGALPSLVETNSYFVDAPDHTLPVVSISGPELGSGNWGGGDDFLTTVELFSEDGVEVAEAHGTTDEHGSDSNAYDQRGFDFKTKDALGHDHHLSYPVFNSTDRDQFKRLIFRAAGFDNYSFQDGATHMRDLLCSELTLKADLDVDARRSQHCILYANGEYRGLYEMREKVDDPDYFEYYYDQSPGSVDFVKTWGGTWEEYGSADDWWDLVDFGLATDLCDDSNFETISEEIQISSITDFFILQSFVVKMEMLNWNQSWWKGNDPDGGALKWRYALWDNDMTLGNGVNYTGIPNTSSSALPCDILTLGDPGGAGHIPLLNELMSNFDFKSQYVERYVELAGTYFSCDYMNGLIDSLVNVMEPEMPGQVEHWGGTMEEWYDNIQELRDFVDARCDSLLIDLIEECWDIDTDEGFNLTINVEGDGTVEVNFNNVTVTESSSPHIFNNYVCEGLFELQAINGDDDFVIWELVEGYVPIGTGTNPLIQFELEEDVEITAHFESTVDISEVESPRLGVYPNPVIDQLNIDSEIPLDGIIIYDATGREILSEKLNQQLRVALDMSQFESGVYLVEVGTEVGFYTRRVIKD